MEVTINKEIRNYRESLYFGLSLRQFLFSLAAILVAVAIYFVLSAHVGTEMVSWLCVLGATPFAVMGFFSYHGMTAEQFLVNWVRTVLVEPKQFAFRSESLWFRLVSRRERHHD